MQLQAVLVQCLRRPSSNSMANCCVIPIPAPAKCQSMEGYMGITWCIWTAIRPTDFVVRLSELLRRHYNSTIAKVIRLYT